MSAATRTMFDKIWAQHVVVQRDGGEALLYIDRNIVHEGSFHAFGQLAREGRKVRRPRQNIATADHYVPTANRERGIAGGLQRRKRGHDPFTGNSQLTRNDRGFELQP